jgi:hypothetical protein
LTGFALAYSKHRVGKEMRTGIHQD